MTQSVENDLARFIAYGLAITSRAVTALRHRQDELPWFMGPELNRAYRFGLTYASSLPLKDLQQQATDLGISLYKNMSAREEVIKNAFLLNSADELINQLGRDKNNLAFLWEHDAGLAESAQIWLAMNDVYEFAVCFAQRCVYEDDYRGIRNAVEWSIKLHGIFDVWQSLGKIEYPDFVLPPASRGLYSQTSLDGLHA